MNRNRYTFSLPFLVLTVAFVVCIIIANLTEIKTVSVGNWFTITAGVVVFPISYIINDCVVEVYGFARARVMIWLGFAMSLLVAVMLQLALWLPGSPEWEAQAAMETIYGAVPRIMFASFAAFLAGSFLNAWVMSRMKRSRRGRPGGFGVRAIVSTLWGEGIDSLIFFPIAFGGHLPWLTIASLIVTQLFIKTFYEIIILPVTMVVVKNLKRIEGLDRDDDINDNQTPQQWWKNNI